MEAQHIVVNKGIKVPRRKVAPKVPHNVRSVALSYKAAYKKVYGINPYVGWDGTWYRLAGASEGVNLRRLKEMTTQLHRRAG